MASVKTSQSQAKQRSVIAEAKEKLKAIEQEESNSFDEVYRRLVQVSVVTFNELEGAKPSGGGDGNNGVAEAAAAGTSTNTINYY